MKKIEIHRKEATVEETHLLSGICNAVNDSGLPLDVCIAALMNAAASFLSVWARETGMDAQRLAAHATYLGRDLVSLILKYHREAEPVIVPEQHQ